MPQDPIQLTFETVTPIYTGGADMSFDRLHETGLMGGLRWWYEVFVRGVGGDACDPSGHRCLYDPDKPHDGICDACCVFGATGWRRRFRLVVDHDQLAGATYLPDALQADPALRGPQGSRWPWPDTPQQGRFALTLQSLADDFDVNLIAALLGFVANYATLGGKDQIGLGVVRDVNGRAVDPTSLCMALTAIASDRVFDALPALDNIFLAAVKVPSNRSEETANLRVRVRNLFRTGPVAGVDLRHTVMGDMDTRSRETLRQLNERRRPAIGSKINVSLPVDNRIRLTGWLPREHEVYGGRTRDQIVQAIRDEIDDPASPYRLVYWREFNTPRDTVTPNEADRLRFARHLLECPS